MPAKTSPRGPAPKKEAEAIPLRRFLSAFFRRKWMILNFSIAGLVIGLVTSVFINPVNVWKGIIPVSVRSPGRFIAPLLEGSPAGGREEFNLQDEIQYWLSDRVIENTAKECGLSDQQKETYEKEKKTLRYRILSWFEDKLQGILPSPDPAEGGGASDEDARLMNAAKRTLMREIEIGRSQMRPQDASSYYIEITYRNRLYPKVREVLESLVKNYQTYRKDQMKSGLQDKVKEILYKQRVRAVRDRDEMAKRLNEKYEQLKLFPGSDFNGIVEELRSSVRDDRARLDRLNDERRRTERQLEVAQKNRENLLSRKEDLILMPTQTVGQQRTWDDYRLEALFRNLTELEIELKNPNLAASQRAEKEARYKALLDEVRKLESGRTETGETQKMRSPEMARLDAEIEMHKAVLDGLKEDVAEIEKSVTSGGRKLAEAQAQVVDANRIRDQYETAESRVEQIDRQIELQAASEEAQESIAYVTPHDVRMEAMPVPLHKFGRKVVLLLATFMGLGLGLALALGLDILDSSLNSVDELEEKVGLPVLASIQEYKKVRLIPRQG